MARQIENCNFEMEETKARRMTESELRWSMKDAKAAAEIHDEMDRQGTPNNSGKYWDQYHTYGKELTKRVKKQD